MHSHERTLIQSLGFQDKDRQKPLHDKACLYLSKPEQAKRLVKMFGPDTSPPNDEKYTSIKHISDTLDVELESPIHDHGRLVGYADLVIKAKTSYLVGGGKVRHKEENCAVSHCSGDCCKFPHFINLEHEELVNWYRDERYRHNHNSPAVHGSFGPQERTKFGQLQQYNRMRAERCRMWEDFDLMGQFVELEWFEDETRVLGHCSLLVEVKTSALPPGDVIRQLKFYAPAHLGRFCASVLATTFEVSSAYKEALAAEKIHCIRLGAGFEKWLAEEKVKKADVAEF